MCCRYDGPFYSSLNCLLAGFPWLTTDCHYTDSLNLQWRWRLVCRENIPEMEVHSTRRMDTKSHFFFKVHHGVYNYYFIGTFQNISFVFNILFEITNSDTRLQHKNI